MLRIPASVLIVTGFIFSASAWADPPDETGRISYVNGNVSYHSQSDEQWSTAWLNYPLIVGDSLWTDTDGRAEIDVGPLQVRQEGNTELGLTQLNDQTTTLYVQQGRIAVRLNAIEPGKVYQLQTANGTVTLENAGNYQLDAGSAQSPLRMTVWEGEARIISTGGSLVETHAGQTVIVPTIIGVPPTIERAVALADDHWTNAALPQTVQYVPPYVSGYQDLANNGQWTQEAEYGALWLPTTIPEGWAPYRYGHWAWVPPWGWTWIDNASWGFAPFHYGRWMQWHDRWAWAPGRLTQERPVYAPALVAFIGGNDWEVTLNQNRIPAMGWVPLAPQEVYVPHYTVSEDYFRRVNNPNVANMAGRTLPTTAPVPSFTNQHFVTIVPTSVFNQAKPVAAAALPIAPNTIAAAPVISHFSALPAPVPHSFTPAVSVPSVTPPVKVPERATIAPATPTQPLEQQRPLQEQSEQQMQQRQLQERAAAEQAEQQRALQERALQQQNAAREATQQRELQVQEQAAQQARQREQQDHIVEERAQQRQLQERQIQQQIQAKTNPQQPRSEEIEKQNRATEGEVQPNEQPKNLEH
jgi:hypothetical protein